jgi:phage-related protein
MAGQRAPHQAFARASVGNAHEGERWNFPGFYVTVVGKRVVVVRVFVKKTQKTPSGEIELALKRAKEILQ